jgi:hypothetical protein
MRQEKQGGEEGRRDRDRKPVMWVYKLLSV